MLTMGNRGLDEEEISLLEGLLLMYNSFVLCSVFVNYLLGAMITGRILELWVACNAVA